MLPYDESNFEVALLGYNRRQVDRHIDELHQRLADATVAFDAAVALQNQLNDARAEIRKLRRLAHNLPGGAPLGDRVTAILEAAERQAGAIRAQAEQDAAAIREHDSAEAPWWRRYRDAPRHREHVDATR
jgi:cell division septum initiation protein DivIVA